MKNSEKNKTVCVAMVTFNRKDLLKVILNNFSNSSYHISAIVLVNNNSNDDTEKMLFSEGFLPKNNLEYDRVIRFNKEEIDIHYYKSSVNMGGSGGFAKAFDIAETLDYDYIWAMDDDVLPDTNCLSELMYYQDDACGVTIPNRYGEGWKEKAIIDYNLTNPFLHRIRDYKKTIYSDDIDCEYIDVVDMPLEGPLIRMDVARRTGIPNKDYFIMYDDTDFAHRLNQFTNIRFVKNAKLKRMLATKDSTEEWDWKTYYLTRNTYLFDKKYGKNVFVRKLRPLIYFLTKIYSAIRDKAKYKYYISRRAYLDFKNNKLGMTVKPGTNINEIR